MSFKVKSSHAIEQLNYGKRHGYDTFILSIKKDDPTDAQYFSSMDLRRALDYLQRKVNKFSLRLISIDFILH